MKRVKDSLGGRNPLTAQDAGLLADALAHGMDYEGADVARLLLLIHSLAYELDATAREEMLGEAELKLAAYLPGVTEATEAAMRRQLDALKGGKG